MNQWKPSPQVGGVHYDLPIQPITFIMANELGFCEGNAIKYLCRYMRKGTPRQDLLKARQYIDFLLEQYPEESPMTLSEELDKNKFARRTGG